MKKNKILIIISVVLVCWLFYYYIYDGTINVRSNLDGQYYKVQNKPDSQLRADILANLRMKLGTLVDSLKKSTYYTNSSGEFYIPVRRLVSNWEAGVSIKEVGNWESDAAYVINKKHMSFCLQKSRTLNLPEMNLITYVAIHELSHVMSIDTDHGGEFIKNFDFLLNFAKGIKYYDPLLKGEYPLFINLKELDTSNSYCGVSIENSIT